MNKLMMIGRLSRDPEIRVSQDGQTTVARFGIAVDRRGKDQKADFFNVTAFNKTAQFVEKYLKKGTKIAIAGRLQQDEYTNKDGQKVTSVSIVADEVEFCESKKSVTDSNQPVTDDNGFMPIDKLDQEELPFNF